MPQKAWVLGACIKLKLRANDKRLNKGICGWKWHEKCH